MIRLDAPKMTAALRKQMAKLDAMARELGGSWTCVVAVPPGESDKLRVFDRGRANQPARPLFVLTDRDRAEIQSAIRQKFLASMVNTSSPSMLVVMTEAEDPLAELYNNNQSGSSDGSGSSSTGADATGDGNKDSASSKDAEYQRLLDTGDGVMGSIRIPKISVDLPIYHGTSEQTLASGAGHLYGSSLPVGGKDTHAVITGHRGLVEASMFTRLDEMRVGDYFYIDVMGHTLGYMVDRITEIEPNDTSQLKITSGEDRVTLMTCTPYGVNTHRLLVSALRSAIPEEIPAEDDAAKDVRVIAGVVSAATLLVGLLLVWLLRCPWHVRRHAAWWPKRN